MNAFERFSPYMYSIMRIIFGLMFACHGAQKLFGMFGGRGAATGIYMVGGMIELVCGLAIAIGLLTRPAAFIASGMMAVAYFMVHASGQAIGHAPNTAEMFFPLLNKGEPAVLYCFIFLYMVFRGSGPLGLDDLLFKRDDEAAGG